MDVGCGTGVLSLFAAQAGARAVVAVERAPSIAALARRIVARNNLSAVITVVEGRVESLTELPRGLQSASWAEAASQGTVSDSLSQSFSHSRGATIGRTIWPAIGGSAAHEASCLSRDQVGGRHRVGVDGLPSFLRR